MNAYQNALAYITRKKKRTLILILILTLVLSGLFSCLRIEQASSITSQKLLDNTSTSLSIASNNPDGFLIKELEDLKTTTQVKQFLPQYSTLAKIFNLEVVSKENQIKKDKLTSDYQNLVEIKALNNSSLDELFRSGNFKLIEGKHLNETGENNLEALIHEDLAKKNKVKLNQTIELSFFKQKENKVTKERYKFKVVGIFKGLKQEKFTGLSADLSANHIYLNYDGYLKSLGLNKENATANKVTLITASKEDTNLIKERFEKLNLANLFLTNNNAEMNELSSATKSLKALMKMLTYTLMIAASIVLILILILWLRERLYEIGVYLAIGREKKLIYWQLLLEVIFLSLPSAFLSFFIGNILYQQTLQQLTSSEELGVAANNLSLASVSALPSFIKSYLLLLIIIVVSTSFASFLLLRKKPRVILTQIN